MKETEKLKFNLNNMEVNMELPKYFGKPEQINQGTYKFSFKDTFSLFSINEYKENIEQKIEDVIQTEKADKSLVDTIHDKIGSFEIYEYILKGNKYKYDVFMIDHTLKLFFMYQFFVDNLDDEICVDNKNAYKSINVASVEKHTLNIECPFCHTKFDFDISKMPAEEKTFYCKCPNCHMELKQGVPDRNNAN